RWEAAWNSHQPPRLLALMTEDIAYDDSAWPRTMRGHADVREFLGSTWRALPDLEFQTVAGPFVEHGAPRAALYWKGTGTFTGPLDPPGLAPTGARIEFEGFDLHEYRDGRVCRLRIVFDMMDVSRQIGMVPKQGSRLENAGAAAQRLGVRVRDRLRR
ncbi:MAG: ester cyclase, partial [Solirubrobacteraceae bacterium]